MEDDDLESMDTKFCDLCETHPWLRCECGARNLVIAGPTCTKVVAYEQLYQDSETKQIACGNCLRFDRCQNCFTLGCSANECICDMRHVLCISCMGTNDECPLCAASAAAAGIFLYVFF